MIYDFVLETTKKDMMINIDQKLISCIKESGVKEGEVKVFIPHTTAGVTINENADPDVVRDMLYEMNKIVPLKDGYNHMEGNSAAHIKASMFGSSESVFIRNGKLVLGTWQSVYFCEFDGPRKRHVIVKIIED